MISALLGLGNRSELVFPAAARTGTVLSPVFRNYYGGALSVLLEVITSPGGGETLAVNLYSDDLAHVIVASLAANPYANLQRGALVLGPGVTLNWTGPNLSTARATLPPGLYSVEVVPSVPASSWTYVVTVGETVV